MYKSSAKKLKKCLNSIVVFDIKDSKFICVFIVYLTKTCQQAHLLTWSIKDMAVFFEQFWSSDTDSQLLSHPERGDRTERLVKFHQKFMKTSCLSQIR